MKTRTTQLIIGGVVLPYVAHDRYRAYPDMLGRQSEMISGRVVEEQRGKVWRVSYSCDYLPTETKDAALAVLRSGEPFEAVFLPDNSTEMVAATVRTESLTPPSFAFTSHGVVRWHELTFTLREVTPHA